ncbi:hypothetical protein [Ligilactobacillus ruminis]|uniref:hypothetical protein n=1 Tax=Ligilactobacillus ruminis TaxID=1623 RepID=UPI0022E38BA0|nr:hypothetical protein [Ligilactobacillus ruminis]
MINTMFGEVMSEFDDCVVIDHRGIPVWLTKEELEIIKLPKLNEDERKYYDELKGVKNGDKRGMVSHVNFDVMNLGLTFEHGGYYRIIEAIIKGGYNY